MLLTEFIDHFTNFCYVGLSGSAQQRSGGGAWCKRASESICLVPVTLAALFSFPGVDARLFFRATLKADLRRFQLFEKGANSLAASIGTARGSSFIAGSPLLGGRSFSARGCVADTFAEHVTLGRHTSGALRTSERNFTGGYEDPNRDPSSGRRNLCSLFVQ